MSDAIKVAYLTDGIFPWAMGGMQKFSRQLLDQLLLDSSLQIDLLTYVPDREKFVTVSEVKESLGKLHNAYIPPKIQLPNFPGHYLWENHLISKKMSSVLEREKYDVVFGHGFTLWHYLTRKNRSPAIVHLHGLEPYQSLSTWLEQLRSVPLRIPIRSIARKSDRVISLGNFFSQIFEKKIGVVKEKIIEIPGAVDSGWIKKQKSFRRSRKSSARFTFLYVGRYEKRKGIELILKVAKGIREAEFEFAGEMPLKLMKRCETWPNVRFLGPIWDEDQLLRHYTEADCVVVPSYAEGMPMVVLEAMGAGLPVIASSVGMIPEMLKDGGGLLVRPGSREQLYDAMKQMMAMTKESLREMGRKGQEKVLRQYTWEKVGRQFSALIHELARK